MTVASHETLIIISLSLIKAFSIHKQNGNKLNYFIFNHIEELLKIPRFWLSIDFDFEWGQLRHFQPLNLTNTYFCLIFYYYGIFNHKNEILFFYLILLLRDFCLHVNTFDTSPYKYQVPNLQTICISYVLCGDHNESNENRLHCVIYILRTINLAFQKCSVSEDLVVACWRL